ncbi:hypothetical protein BT93_K2030 [Corymbia citriodora subsp. variegata]|nr:hypothetical protein BT93_K2030 [Corymbia citriodora subsp. variegata]
MSEDRSYGSNFFASSQSRKISIGIMVDSSARRTPGPVRDNEVAVPTELGVDANKQDLAGGGVAINRGRQNECREHEGSPWISKRSTHKNSAGSKGVLRAKLTGTKTDKNEMQSKPNGLKGPPVDHSVQRFPNQASFLQSDNVGRKRFDGHKINEERNENAETVHKCASSTVKVFLTSDGATLGDKTGSIVKNQSESLRIKLRELLESVASPNKEKTSSPPVEVGITSLQPEQNWNQTVNAVIKPKPNSDTIENDSESPYCSNRRPVTRALAQKRASSKRPKRRESGLLSSYKQNPKERNIFSSEEGHIGRRGTAKGSSSKVISNKKTERKYARIDPRKLSFSSKNNQDENQHSTDRNENSASEERSSPHGYRRQSLHDFTLPVNINLEKICREKDLPEQPAISKPCQHEASNRPALAKNKDQREGTGNTFPKVHVDRRDDFPSPTFQKTWMAGSSPSPLIQEDQVGQEAGKFAHVKGIFDKKNLFSFKIHSRKVQDGSREVAKELPDSPPRAAVHSKENDVDHSSSESSSEEKESERSEEDGTHEEEAFSPETGVAEKLKFMLHRTKRLCSDAGIQSHDSDPASSSPKETGESNLAQHMVEENTEDGHARDIGLLALALEKLKSKLKSVTRKKSAEILTSVTERIHVQLQTVESQIQSDMGKLKSLNKQKRKLLEAEFQEASHKKLILQLEEAIGTQLHDAEKRISDMNKLAREQMLQLKLVMEKCLEGGLLS